MVHHEPRGIRCAMCSLPTVYRSYTFLFYKYWGKLSYADSQNSIQRLTELNIQELDKDVQQNETEFGGFLRENLLSFKIQPPFEKYQNVFLCTIFLYNDNFDCGKPKFYESGYAERYSQNGSNSMNHLFENDAVKGCLKRGHGRSWIVSTRWKA